MKSKVAIILRFSGHVTVFLANLIGREKAQEIRAEGVLTARLRRRGLKNGLFVVVLGNFL